MNPEYIKESPLDKLLNSLNPLPAEPGKMSIEMLHRMRIRNMVIRNFSKTFESASR